MSLQSQPPGSFRSDKQFGKVIAGDTLHRTGACVHDFSGGEHHLKAHDIVARRPLLGPLDSSRIGIDVSPEKHGNTPRVRWKGESVFGEGPGSGRHRPRQPDPSVTVLNADFGKIVHPGEIDDDAPWDRSSTEACARTPGDDGDLLFIRRT